MDLIPSGSLKSFRINEREVMVINYDNRFFCLQARCTHAGAPLAEGKLEDEILTCPWHGSKFRITDGELVKGPAEKPLQVYKTVVKNDALYVDFE